MSAAANDANAAPDDDLLTDEDVVARYRGRITLGTLRNWRALKIGPPYIKVGKAVLYVLGEDGAGRRDLFDATPPVLQGFAMQHGFAF